jgi:methionine-S-sulfoxide reductase
MRKRLTILISLFGLLLTTLLFAAMDEQSISGEKMTMNNMKTARAIFAGGCFWCMEPPFEKLEGVLSVTSGFTGGQLNNPSYNQVSAGGTGHTEAIEIVYDPAKTSYPELLEVFWRQIDPTDAGGQFVDRGSQYRSGIYPLDAEQQRLAEESKQNLAASGRFDRPIVTEIIPATAFYTAENYHQDYYKKNPVRYKFYRYGSGRDRFLERVWGEDHLK